MYFDEKTEKHFAFIIHDCNSYDVGIIGFATKIPTPEEAEEAVRRAVESYLMSNEAHRICAENHGVFDWRMAAASVPDIFFMGEGLHVMFKTVNAMMTSVEHDENLAH